MEPLYFRIVERPDPAVFVAGWRRIVEERFILDRSVWRRPEVSRAASAVLRYDRDEQAWELKNTAEGRVLILDDGRQRYDLRRGMSVALEPGSWRCTLTGAFSFELTSQRPVGLAEHGAVEDGDRVPEDVTVPWQPVQKARDYLAEHWYKRYGLSILWRQHLEHTKESPRDLPPATVGRAFGVEGSTVTGWREELAMAVYRERGHQQAVRELVVDHGVLTGSDVRAAVRYLHDFGGNAPERPRP